LPPGSIALVPKRRGDAGALARTRGHRGWPPPVAITATRRS